MDGLIDIAKHTNNDAIIMVIVVVIGCAVLFGIAYPQITKARKEKRKQYMEQQKLNQDMTKQMMGVIEKNTEAYTKLAVIIENTDSNCRTCKVEQADKMDKVVDAVNELIRTVELLTSMNTNLYRILVDRGEITPETAIR